MYGVARARRCWLGVLSLLWGDRRETFMRMPCTIRHREHDSGVVQMMLSRGALGGREGIVGWESSSRIRNKNQQKQS